MQYFVLGGSLFAACVQIKFVRTLLWTLVKGFSHSLHEQSAPSGLEQSELQGGVGLLGDSLLFSSLLFSVRSSLQHILFVTIVFKLYYVLFFLYILILIISLPGLGFLPYVLSFADGPSWSLLTGACLKVPCN